MANGSVIEIYLYPDKGGPATVVEAATVAAAGGLEGDRQRSGRRAITLLSREVWDETTVELGVDLPPQTRRANLLVSGLDLRLLIGKRASLGEVEIQIRGETTPCVNMDRAHAGLMQALERDQRGGVFATVFRGGSIRVGDQITVWGSD